MKRFTILITAYLVVACTPADDAGQSTSGLTFIHMNDTYRVGAVESGKAGGFGRVVTVVKDAQARGRDVRVLHGGDFLYPSLESQLWNGAQMVDAFNYIDAIAPMYVVAGNHEFDRRTPEHLANAVRESDFDWLGDNYRFETGDIGVDDALQSNFMFEHEGRRVGIFSLTLHADHGGNARDYAPINVNYFTEAKRTLEALEASGADLIIGLTHLHMEDDLRIAALREEHPNFLFVVGGHEHELEYRAATETSAAVMKGASNARVVWEVNIDFGVDDKPVMTSHRHIAINGSIESDPGYAELESRWRSQLLEKFPFLTARVGEAAVSLDAREVTIRNVESNWGSFVVDQMRRAFDDGEADLAFINSGTLRIDDYIAGAITFEDIGRTFGFSSYLRYLTISGAEFKTLLEAGYRGEGPSKGYFPQVSGFRVCVDRSREDGDRIVSLQLPTDKGWAEIEPGREYSLVAPDYIYGGGDGYEFPANRVASKPGSELKYLVLDAILRAQGLGEAVGEPVTPENRRYHALAESKDRCFL